MYFDLTKGNLSFIGKTRHHQDFHLNDAWFMFSNPVRQMPYISNFRGLLFYGHLSNGEFYCWSEWRDLNPRLTEKNIVALLAGSASHCSLFFSSSASLHLPQAALGSVAWSLTSVRDLQEAADSNHTQ